LEETFKGHLVQPPSNEQGLLQLDQVVQSPVQPGLEGHLHHREHPEVHLSDSSVWRHCSSAQYGSASTTHSCSQPTLLSISDLFLSGSPFLCPDHCQASSTLWRA